MAGITYHSPRERPQTVWGVTIKLRTGCGNLYLTVNTDDDGLCELFAHLGKAGGCAAGMLEGCMKLASIALRAGMDPKHIAKQLTGVRCPNGVWDEERRVLSCLDAIGSSLGRILRGEHLDSDTWMKTFQQAEDKPATKKDNKK